MSKPTITKLFAASLIALVAGIVLAAVGAAFAIASGAFIVTGPGITGVDVAQFTGGAIITLTVATLGIVGGAIGQFVAWIGAVVNTARLEDKTWFILLLVLGLLSFGFIAMLIYILAGPNEAPMAREGRTYSPTPA